MDPLRWDPTQKKSYQNHLETRLWNIMANGLLHQLKKEWGCHMNKIVIGSKHWFEFWNIGIAGSKHSLKYGRCIYNPHDLYYTCYQHKPY